MKQKNYISYLYVLVIFFLFILFFFNQLWAAENGDSNGDKTSKNEIGSEEFDPLVEFRYSPSQSLDKDYLDGEFETKLYKKINKQLAKSRDELEGFYDTMEFRQSQINKQIITKGGEYFRINPSITTNTFNQLISYNSVQNNFFLDRTIDRLLQLEELFDYSFDSLSLVYEEKDLKNLAYNLESLLGLLYLYKGTPTSLVKATEKFSSLVGKNKFNYNFTEGNPNRRKVIFEHLISIYTYLYHFYHNQKNHLANYYKIKRLEYMWDLVKLNHKENPELLKVKQRKIIKSISLDDDSIALLSKSDKFNEIAARLEGITGTDNSDILNTQKNKNDKEQGEESQINEVKPSPTTEKKSNNNEDNTNQKQ